jgi:GxxExxY protein
MEEKNYKINRPGEVIFPELCFEIMKVLFEVHSDLGGRYQEKYYQRAVALGFEKEGIKYSRELCVPLKYNNQIIGKYFLDFLVENKVVVELKTVTEFVHDDVRQVLSYLKVNNLPLGILVNFRGKSLTYKRIINEIKDKANIIRK